MSNVVTLLLSLAAAEGEADAEEEVVVGLFVEFVGGGDAQVVGNLNADAWGYAGVKAAASIVLVYVIPSAAGAHADKERGESGLEEVIVRGDKQRLAIEAVVTCRIIRPLAAIECAERELQSQVYRGLIEVVSNLCADLYALTATAKINHLIGCCHKAHAQINLYGTHSAL